MTDLSDTPALDVQVVVTAFGRVKAIHTNDLYVSRDGNLYLQPSNLPPEPVWLLSFTEVDDA